MARQSVLKEKPGSGHPAASGFLRSNLPINLKPGQIRRGDYCHRYFVCANQNRIDPDQTVCLICTRFISLFAGVDPLAQAVTMGYKVGYKTVKEALVFEAKAALKAEKIALSAPAVAELPPAEAPAPTPETKKCGNPRCKNPVLPATTKYFYRNRNKADGLSSYCKVCQKEKQSMSDQRLRALRKEAAEVAA